MYMEFKNEMPRVERARRDSSSWLSAPVGSWRYYRIKESVQMLIVSCKRRYYLAFKLVSLEGGDKTQSEVRNAIHDTNLSVDTIYRIHGVFREDPVKRVGSSRKSYAGFLPKPIGQQRLVMPIDALRPCRKYRIASGNEFRLFREFDPNTECFQRISDGMLHFGREFIGFRNGERIVELVEV